MNKYPWLVRIFHSGDEKGHCGGTLVASKYVITACHCLYEYKEVEDSVGLYNPEATYKPVREYKAREIEVSIGDHKLDTTNETGREKRVKIKSIKKHYKWDRDLGTTHGYDIAILELEVEVDLTIHTPACLAKLTEGTRFNGERAVAAGWGITENPKPYPPVTSPNEPYEVELRVALSTATACKDPTDQKTAEDPSILCALSPDNLERGACKVSIEETIDIFLCEADLEVLMLFVSHLLSQLVSSNVKINGMMT